MAFQQRRTNASYRGQRFFCSGLTYKTGRNQIVYEHIDSDSYSVIDLGGKVKAFSFKGYLVSDNFDLDRNRFQSALNLGGPGILKLPTYDAMQVQIGDTSFDEDTEGANLVTFTISCSIIPSALVQSSFIDLLRRVVLSVNEARAQVASAFLSNTSNIINQSQAVFSDSIATFFLATDNYVSLFGFEGSRFSMYKKERDAILQNTVSLINNPIDLVNQVSTLFDNLLENQAAITIASALDIQTTNSDIDCALGQSLVTSVVRSASNAVYLTNQEAFSIRGIIVNQIKNEEEFCALDQSDLYLSLVNMRNNFARAVPGDRNFTLRECQVSDVTSLLALLYEKNATVDNVQDIISINSLEESLVLPMRTLLV